jgi:RHS repeat-associated protein
MSPRHLLLSRLTQVTDPTGVYTFAYDNVGRLTGTSTQYLFLSGTQLTNTYGYDAASNRVSFTNSQLQTTNYVYDSLNRLTGITDFNSGQFGFGYDALGRQTSLTPPNGVNTSYSYDTLSRLLSVLHGGGSLPGSTSYTYDAAGNRTSKTAVQAGNPNPVSVLSQYSYDPIYELTQAVVNGSVAESYGYDAVGNRLTSVGPVTYNYNASNELTSTPVATYAYDGNGNTAWKIDSTGTTSYTWDYENRLTRVTLPGTGGTVNFQYDPFGRRIQKSGPLGTTNYVYDGFNLMGEVDNSGTLLARFTEGLGVDEQLSQLRSDTASYYQADGLGSVTSLTNPAGAVGATYGYDTFGNLITSTGTLTNSFQYTGREFDTETSLYYYRARYYDPSTGRFLGEDPAHLGGGQLNFYSYVLNNPLRYADPSGRVIEVNGSPQQNQDYHIAIGYLQNDPGTADIINVLSNSATVYHINFNNEDNDSFNPSTNTINWDPRSGCSCSTGNGIQSPALGLGHEMAHAAIAKWLGGLLTNLSLFAGDYDNWEEWRVITGAELDAARNLGEPVRTDHRCSATPKMPSPTSHSPAIHFPQEPQINFEPSFLNNPYQ